MRRTERMTAVLLLALGLAGWITAAGCGQATAGVTVTYYYLPG